MSVWRYAYGRCNQKFDRLGTLLPRVAFRTNLNPIMTIPRRLTIGSLKLASGISQIAAVEGSCQRPGFPCRSLEADNVSRCGQSNRIAQGCAHRQ